MPINKARSAIRCLHAQLLVKLISSSALGMLLLGSKLLRGIRVSVLLLRRHEPYTSVSSSANDLRAPVQPYLEGHHSLAEGVDIRGRTA